MEIQDKLLCCTLLYGTSRERHLHFSYTATDLKVAPAKNTYSWVSRVLLQGQAELLLESYLINS